MKDFLSRFSFGDVVAYLLPGFATLSAILAIATFTPLQQLFERAPRDISFIHALAFGCASYVFGALISGSSAALVPWLFVVTRWTRYVEPRNGICPHELVSITKAAFARVFPDVSVESWSPNHFYLIRTAVHQTLPQAAAECVRQNSLMQLRENLLLPTLLWGVASFLYGIDQYRRAPMFALTIMTVSVIGTYLVAGRLAVRACENRRREVREVCLGFVMAERLKLFPQAPTPGISPLANESVHVQTPESLVRNEFAGNA